MTEPATTDAPIHPLKQIVQPFIDLIHSPRALWGVNLAYVLEGTAYFGVLSYLALYFSDYVFIGVPTPDVPAGLMVGVLTAGHHAVHVLPRFRGRQVRRPTRPHLGVSAPARRPTSDRRRRLCLPTERSRFDPPPRDHGRDRADRDRLRHVPAGRLHRRQAVHESEDRGDGFRHALRADEPRRLVAELRLPTPRRRLSRSRDRRCLLGLCSDDGGCALGDHRPAQQKDRGKRHRHRQGRDRCDQGRRTGRGGADRCR